MVANEDLEKAKTYLNQVSWADGLMFAPKNMKEIPLLLNILGQGWVYPEEEKQSPFVIGPEPGPLGLPSSTLPLGHQLQMWACTSQVYCRWPRSELSFHCLLSSQCANLELQCLWWSFSEPCPHVGMAQRLLLVWQYGWAKLWHNASLGSWEQLS